MSRALLMDMLAYCERTGTRDTMLGRKTVGDSTIVGQIRRGRNVTQRNEARIRAMMAKHPEGFHAPRGKPTYNNNTNCDNRSPWEIAADNRAGSIKLRERLGDMAPATEAARTLTFEEKLALVASGKVGLVSAVKPQAAYSYSLVGGSLD